MSLVNIVHRLAFLLRFNLIIHHYYAYINVFTLVHLSVFKIALVDLTVFFPFQLMEMLLIHSEP